MHQALVWPIFSFRNPMAKARSLYDASIRFRGTREPFSNWLSGSDVGALSKQCDFMPPWTNKMRGCMFFLVCRTRSVEEMSQQVCKSWIRGMLSLPSLSALDKVKVNKTKDTWKDQTHSTTFNLWHRPLHRAATAGSGEAVAGWALTCATCDKAMTGSMEGRCRGQTW